MPLRRFEDKVVILTGAATGSGRAAATRLAKEGARLWLIDVNDEGLAAAGGEAETAGAPGSHVAHRRQQRDRGSEFRRGLREAVRSLDALVNAAGVIRYAHFHDHTLDLWNKLLAVNLTGTFLMCRAALPHLLEAKGAIVNFSSNAALSGHAWTAAYTAAKGGVHSLTRLLAVEYGKQGVRTNAICPGGIETNMSKQFQLPEDADPKLLRRIMCLDQPRMPETWRA